MEILAIHILRTLEHDTLNWTENTNNVFTVKSAYRVVLRMKERSRIEHSTTGNVWAMCWGKLQKCSNGAREFFNLFKLLVEKLPQLELEAGQWCLGQYGTQGINSTLTESNSIQKSS
uniref:Uncharacterized protein n=1 Tax=Quercus lobata TaxID=97700 RepID=A0A7N2LPR1_QUELO